MNYELLLKAVKSNSVIRYVNKLEPISSDGLVCPPTYANRKEGDPPYIAFRKAFLEGEQRDIVVLDSPQSQSNRIEQALLDAYLAGRIPYPNITVEFPPEMNEPSVSVLQLSHRVYDAVMRAANMGSEPFYSSAIGQAIKDARPSNATALFEHAPITLVLGGWDSNGGNVSQAAKLQRLMTSEIIGLDAQPASLSATKFDVLGIRKNAAELIERKDSVKRFTIKTSKDKGSGKKPSALGFGNIPSTEVPRAAVISSAIQTSILSCSGLRRLSFPTADNKTHPERDQAGHAVLAALALYGLFAQNESGYLLRSRCELIPKDDGQVELIGRTLKDIETISLSADVALALLKEAIDQAAGFDLTFRSDDIALDADDRLIDLVRRSRADAAAGDGD